MRKILELYPASVSKRKLPLNFIPGDSKLFERELKREIPSLDLFEDENVTIGSGPSFYKAFVPSIIGKSVQSYASDNPLSKLRKWIKHILFSNTIERDEVLWVTDGWSVGYFHWMTESLPRIWAVRTQNQLGSCTLALPSDFKDIKFIGSTLAILGVQPIYLNEREVLKVHHLIFPATQTPSGNYQSDLIRSLRGTILSYLEISSSGSRRIFISRKNALKRKIKNEGEVETILTAFGFEIIVFEDLSFKDQVVLSSQASFIVSLHGAGLTNMMFMPSGGQVLEFRKSNDNLNNCYFALASALDLEYLYLECEPLEPHGHNADIVVDPKKLTDVLQTVFGNK